MIKKIAILCLLFFPIQSYSQTLYEFQFSDDKGTEYIGFMVYFSESNAYMRVAFADKQGVYNVVNVDYTATTGRQDDQNYCVFLGTNPSYIVGDKTKKYAPDTFVWLWGDDNVYDLPMRTVDPDFAPESFSKVTAYRELDVTTLTEDYIHQFYYSDEEDYISFLSMINTDAGHTLNNSDYSYEDYNYDTYDYNTTNTTTSNDKVTLHFFIVANTEIGDIGKSCDVDKRNYISEFEGVAEALNINFKPYIFDGKNFTKTKVMDAIKNMNVGKNDVVFFVYTGHGFRWSDQTDKFPMMDMRYNVYQKISEENAIALSDVYSKITSKGGRLNIVFGDCCNSDVGINQRTSSTFLASRSNPNFKQEKLEKLFLKSSGSLIATAASPGEVSWSNDVNGGFFTSSFLSAFHEEISFLSSDVADWDGLIKKTVETAKYKSSPSTCSVCSAQNAVTTIKVAYK